MSMEQLRETITSPETVESIATISKILAVTAAASAAALFANFVRGGFHPRPKITAQESDTGNTADIVSLDDHRNVLIRGERNPVSEWQRTNGLEIDPKTGLPGLPKATVSKLVKNS